MIVRMAPLVPIVIAISPLRIALTPKLERTPSLAPTKNGVSTDSPICRA